jgi:hypothetical protein
MRYPLNDFMSFDHVVKVNCDGTFEHGPANVYAPDLYMFTDDNGSILAGHEIDYIRQADEAGWSLLTGYTGQYSYHGVCMHPSEFIGGGIERDILANPGLYVAIMINTDDGECDSWAVAYRPTCGQFADFESERPLMLAVVQP